MVKQSGLISVCGKAKVAKAAVTATGLFGTTLVNSLATLAQGGRSRKGTQLGTKVIA
jgi:hypothetical protein